MLSNYQIIKSNRKSLAISINLDGSVIIRAPLKTTLKTLNQFVAKYQDWINNKLSSINTLKTTQSAEALFYYLGQRYPIKELNADSNIHDSNKVKFDNNHLLIKYGFINQIAIIMPQWYHAQAKQLLEPIIQEYSQQFKLNANKIKITAAKTRWGSCNSLGTICFSYRIAMLPLSVIRYIVAHEFAHLKHLNHSKLFWQQVALIYPDYKSAHYWLKEHEYLLATNY